MRMWLVDPKKLCRKHLLGEHLEMHYFKGTITKGKSIRGYVLKGLVETNKIKERHDALAKEMKDRGYKHQSEMTDFQVVSVGFVDVQKNLKELSNRCSECRKRIES